MYELAPFGAVGTPSHVISRGDFRSVGARNPVGAHVKDKRALLEAARNPAGAHVTPQPERSKSRPDAAKPLFQGIQATPVFTLPSS